MRDVGAVSAVEDASTNAPTVNASGVFHTHGLRCPEESDCERCDAPLNVGPFHVPANLSALRTVSCRYRAEACDALREEVKACKRAERALCGEYDARARAKKKCRREVNRAWKTRCKEDRTIMVTRVEGAKKQFLTLLEKLRRAHGRLSEGGVREDLTSLEMDLARLKTSLSHSFDEVKKNNGGVSLGAMSRRMESFISSPTSLDSVADMLRVIDIMNAVEYELQKLSTEARNLCSHDASMDAEESKVICEEIEDKMKMAEKRMNRCAARLSDFMVSTAKIDALIVEKQRRFALLQSFEKFADSFNGAWSALTTEPSDDEDDEDFVEEPSVAFNLTEHVTTGIVNVLMSHYATANVRRSMATAAITESALCAQIIPRFQLSLLGSGIRRGDLACPPPHGTFIGGRELPDWSAYFLFLFGVGVGVGVAIATNQANQAVEFCLKNSNIIAAVLVVVLAGRFFE